MFASPLPPRHSTSHRPAPDEFGRRVGPVEHLGLAVVPIDHPAALRVMVHAVDQMAAPFAAGASRDEVAQSRIISHVMPMRVTGTLTSQSAWMNSGQVWNFESQSAHETEPGCPTVALM